MRHCGSREDTTLSAKWIFKPPYSLDLALQVDNRSFCCCFKIQGQSKGIGWKFAGWFSSWVAGFWGRGCGVRDTPTRLPWRVQHHVSETSEHHETIWNTHAHIFYMPSLVCHRASPHLCDAGRVRNSSTFFLMAPWGLELRWSSSFCDFVPPRRA